MLILYRFVFILVIYVVMKIVQEYKKSIKTTSQSNKIQ